MAKLAKIKEYCISNGEGLRTAVFFSGCDFHCSGCFNKELQDPNYGVDFTVENAEKIFATINEHIAGLSILGGEPLSKYNREVVTKLCKEFKKRFPQKTIWLWTGYTLENIQSIEVLNYIDVLIDGQFLQSEYEYGLQWRGSKNQRILYKGVDF